MKARTVLALLCGVVSVGMTTLTSVARASDTYACPVCKMPMPTVKSADFSAPVKIGGKVYYCCTKCPAGKQALAYAKKHHGKPMVVIVPAPKPS